jgi:hypothetical protein
MTRTAKRTTKRTTKRATPAAEPADHDDPRFRGVLAAFAKDPARAAVAEDFAANQMAGGRRKFGSRALKVEGKIFAMLSHGRFVVKLSAARVDALVAAGDGEYFDPGHGRKMKQWLSITSARASWIELAFEAYGVVAGG